MRAGGAWPSPRLDGWERDLRYLAECTAVDLRHLLADPGSHVGPMNRWTGRYCAVAVPARSDDIGLLAGRLWVLHLFTEDAELGAWASRVTSSIASAVAAGLDKVHPGLDLHYGLCLGAEVTGSQRWADLALAAARGLVRDTWSEPAGAFAHELSDGALIAMEGAAFTGALAWVAGLDPGPLAAQRAHLHRLIDLGFVRSDGSCFQVAELGADGRVRAMASYQGYGADSTWARGQAWGMLSYVAGAEEGGETRFLDTALAMADYWLAHTSAYPVPPYDFCDPDPDDVPRDSCAAAIAAGALLRLERLSPTGRYLDAADATLEELCRNYLGRGGLVLHGCGGRPHAPTLFGRPVSRRAPASSAQWRSVFRFPQEEVMGYGNFFLVDALYRRTRPEWTHLGVRSTRFSGSGC